LLGVSLHQSTIEASNRRVTSFQKYVEPFLDSRPNLTVVADALVNRILFSGTRASGVNLTIGNNTQDIMAEREVIISAGAINSPKLLMLSGIGAADALKEQGVKDQVVDLPAVGQNLQDAIIFGGRWSTRQPITDQPANLGYAIVWAHPEDAQQPQVCLEMTRGTYECDQSPSVLEGNYVVTGGAMRQRSRGSIRLASLDPQVAPIIDLNLLSAPGDYEQCRLAFDTMRVVANSPGLSAWRLQEVKPGPNVVADEQIRQWILNNAYSYEHPVGTCAMAGDSSGVVDSRLRVEGVMGLRVVDVSIMPRITSGHTQGPAFMIGDKGADMIMQDA
jgi:choline dehydrogenase